MRSINSFYVGPHRRNLGTVIIGKTKPAQYGRGVRQVWVACQWTCNVSPAVRSYSVTTRYRDNYLRRVCDRSQRRCSAMYKTVAYIANGILGPVRMRSVISYRLCCVYYTRGTVQSFRLSVFHAYPFMILSLGCTMYI